MAYSGGRVTTVDVEPITTALTESLPDEAVTLVGFLSPFKPIQFAQ